jgi:hypothetical protein
MRTFLAACALLILLPAIGPAGEAAEESTFILLNIVSTSNMSRFELVFTNTDDDSLVRISNETQRGRVVTSGAAFILQEIPAGRYFLSAVNQVYDQDIQPVARLRETRDYIELRPGAINYIGNVYLEIDDRRGRNELDVSYEASSSTLIAAVSGERDTFRQHDVFVTMVGERPVPVDKSLLGL